MKIPDRYRDINVSGATCCYLPFGPGGGQRVFLLDSTSKKMTRNMFFTLSEPALANVQGDDEAAASTNVAESARKRTFEHSQQSDVAMLAGIRAPLPASSTIHVMP